MNHVPIHGLDRDAWHAAAEADARQWKADRRERIATAALNGLMANAVVAHTPDVFAHAAVVMADALIAELDKEDKP